MCELWNRLWVCLMWLLCFLLIWCAENSNTISNQIDLSVLGFSAKYSGKVKLEKVYLNDSDLSEILSLYQETWNNSDYKDSLLIAEKYDQWLWVNTFVQQNLDTLEIQWLSLDKVKKNQIIINKNWKDINAVLVEYEITKWFISTVPKLYMSQLFIPGDNSIILFSYMTESSSARWYASTMFRKIK